ncbi:MAG: winged helix-turn-helix transcriptional regulator [Candidatus Bathyarchaeia archaeon]
MVQTKIIECPAEVTLRIISGKWKILVLRELFKGNKRPTELHTALRQITPKVLSQQLRKMEDESLVVRKVYAEIPPKVEYSLTSCGKSLQPVLDALENWGRKHKQARSDTMARTMLSRSGECISTRVMISQKTS